MISRTRTVSRLTLTLALGIGALACSASTQQGGNALRRSSGTPMADGRMFTAEVIQASGATTAWQAIERLASSMHPRQSGFGEPSSFGRNRAAMRYKSAQSTLVVLNGLRIPDLRVLRDIPASMIANMQIISPTRAMILYGDDGWNGAIVIETLEQVR